MDAHLMDKTAEGAFAPLTCPVTGGHPRVRRMATALTLALLSSLVLASCSSGRSTEAFCDKLGSEQERISGQFEEVTDAARGSEDPLEGLLAGLGGSIQAMGELQTYFRELSAVAPEEIRIEMEQITEAFDEQMDAASGAASDPLGALAGSLFNSIAISGQVKTVNDFAVENCGQGI